MLRIAHTLRLAQKHASRADSTRTARTGTGGSTSGSGDSHAADSSRVTRSGLCDGVRAVVRAFLSCKACRTLLVRLRRRF